MKYTNKFRYTDETIPRDIVKLQKPAVSVSVLIFSINKDILEIILVKRVRNPFKDFWSIPGDLIYVDESLKEAAGRVLYEKTGLKNIALQQVAAFGDVERDPRGRVITIGYLALLPQTVVDLSSAPNALHASWISVEKLPPLAFDHKHIIDVAVGQIKKQLEYTPLAAGLLPKSFRLSDLQKVYEVIRGRKIDKRNFRKKILSLNLLLSTGKMDRQGSHRPAMLYSFGKK